MLQNKFEAQREFFPPLKQWAFFDHGTSGLYPTYAHDIMSSYLDRGLNFGMTSEDFANYWLYTDDARWEIAKLFHCTGDDIAFGASSTWLFNIFVNGLDLKPGDNVITSSASHESVPFILLNKQQDGVEVRFVDPVVGATDPEDVFQLVDEHTKAICLNHVEKVTGFRHDLKRYGEFCREHGIAFGVDASHSAGVMHIDVNDMQIDFLTCSGYKWMLTPLGIGAAYISPSLQKSLKLVDTGWCSDQDRWNKNVRKPNTRTNACRFECGGISLVALKGFAAVANRYGELGSHDIQDYVLSLVDYFHKGVKEQLHKIKIFGIIPPQNRSNIVAVFCPEEIHMNEQLMRDNGIRAHCFQDGKIVRFGFHYMNNKDDVDQLLNFLKKVEE